MMVFYRFNFVFKFIALKFNPHASLQPPILPQTITSTFKFTVPYQMFFDEKLLFQPEIKQHNKSFARLKTEHGFRKFVLTFSRSVVCRFNHSSFLLRLEENKCFSFSKQLSINLSG
jgi:hypothetical protein